MTLLASLLSYAGQKGATSTIYDLNRSNQLSSDDQAHWFRIQKTYLIIPDNDLYVNRLIIQVSTCIIHEIG